MGDFFEDGMERTRHRAQRMTVHESGSINDPNVKVGQIYECSKGYFRITAVSGGFASIQYNGSVNHDLVLRNTFRDNIKEGSIRLLKNEIEFAEVLLRL